MNEIIENYGDLTEDELSEFLHIIESDDDDLAFAVDKASKDIADEEELLPDDMLEKEFLPDEMLEDSAWVKERLWDKTEDGKYRFAGIAYRLRSEREEQKKKANALGRAKGTASTIERARIRKLRKIEINRAACSQQDIHISDKVSREALKTLIAELTKDHTEMVDRLDTYINKRFAMLLRPLIPRSVKICAENYPQSVLKCKGFMYKASSDYGKGLCFWVTPDVPYYFTQGTEQRILEKLKPEFLYKIDKAIVQYNYHKNVRAEKEIKYAAALVDNHVNTYFDLLKYNPFWFEKVYQLITGKDLELKCAGTYNN